MSVTPSTLIPTGNLLTTSPTATSSLLLGSGTYFFLGPAEGTGGIGLFDFPECGGLISRGGMKDEREFLGARDHEDRCAELAFVFLEISLQERDNVDDSDRAGDVLRCSCREGARDWTGGRLGGVDTEFDILPVR